MKTKKQFIYTIPVKNLENQNVSDENSAELTLNFKNVKSNYLIHRALVSERKLLRQGSANTKTRSEVRGGGKKPWKQKGTGRARAGSSSSPLWKGGGVVFGPKPKIYKSKLNKKEKSLALQTLIANKSNQNSIIAIKNFSETFNDILKTKHFLDLIEKLPISTIKNNKILIIVNGESKSLIQVTRNLPNVKIIQANSLNVKSLLNSNNIIISFEALKTIEETYNGYKKVR